MGASCITIEPGAEAPYKSNLEDKKYTKQVVDSHKLLITIYSTQQLNDCKIEIADISLNIENKQ